MARAQPLRVLSPYPKRPHAGSPREHSGHDLRQTGSRGATLPTTGGARGSSPTREGSAPTVFSCLTGATESSIDLAVEAVQERRRPKPSQRTIEISRMRDGGHVESAGFLAQA